MLSAPLRSCSVVWMLHALSQLPYTDSRCDATTNSTTFAPIPPDQYDRNYSDITSTGSRPLGYVVGRVLFNSPTVPNPCIRVCGTGAGRSLEVMVETSPPANLCFRDPAVPQTCSSTGYSRACQNFPAMADNCTYFEFYLNSQGLANEADVNFWYRFVVSGVSDDNWCSNRDTDEYPSTLASHLNSSSGSSGPTGATGGCEMRPLPLAPLTATLLAMSLLPLFVF